MGNEPTMYSLEDMIRMMSSCAAKWIETCPEIGLNNEGWSLCSLPRWGSYVAGFGKVKHSTQNQMVMRLRILYS